MPSSIHHASKGQPRLWLVVSVEGRRIRNVTTETRAGELAKVGGKEKGQEKRRWTYFTFNQKECLSSWLHLILSDHKLPPLLLNTGKFIAHRLKVTKPKPAEKY